MKIEEIIKDLNLYEKAIIKIHRKIFNKMFHKTRIMIINNILR